jgi:regulator of cell morphogenesis and NO signaling
MTDLRTSTIKQIVTDDFRTAAVFEKYSLDFCCKGGKTIDEACAEKSVNSDAVLADLGTATTNDEGANDQFTTLALDELIDHIVGTHHAFVRNALPALFTHTQKVASVHGANHPEVVEIARRFAIVAETLQNHMVKEEGILFPYVRSLVDAAERQSQVRMPSFGSAQNPIRMMEAEHQAAGDEMYEIRALSSTYNPPEDACTTFKVTYKELDNFERDLHQHVHLENNILFPKAIALEAQLLSTRN